VKKLVFAVLALSLMEGACDPITATAVGGLSAVGVGTAEERGLEGAVDDTKIRAEINDLWLQHDFTMFSEVTLTVSEGRVMLTGSVGQPDHRVDAVRLAWQAAGVRQVIDEIQVTDQSGLMDYANDAWIANKLRINLKFDSHVRDINYTVDVVNGVVYLMGIAQNQDELDRVIGYARDISKVKRVVSHVVLKTDPKRNLS
jgi:osmotically-inducible protein OsmY